MRVGDQILGRFELGDELEPQGELRRRSAKEASRGESRIVVSAGKLAKLRPGSDQRFLRAYENRPQHPAVLRVVATTTFEGTPISVLPTHTIFPENFPDTNRIEAILCWLAPAVAACAAQLRGEFTYRDLVILDNAEIHLNPQGIVREQSIARLPHHLAPESDPKDAGTSVSAALYGLGVFGFRWITGQMPVDARTMDQLRHGQASPKELRMLAPGITDSLHTLVTGLLSMDPQVRLSVIDGIEAPPSPPTLDLPRTPSVTEPEATPTSASIRHDAMVLKRWTTVLHPPTPTEPVLRRIAGATDFFAKPMAEALGAGLPVPLASFVSEREAEEFITVINEPSARISVENTNHTAGLSWVLAGSTVLGMGAASMLAVGGIMTGPVGAALALSLIGGTFSWRGKRKHERTLRNLNEGAKVGHFRSTIRPEHAQARQLVQDSRTQLRNANVPELMRLDLETALDTIEEALSSLDDAIDSPATRAHSHSIRDAAKAVNHAALQVVASRDYEGVADVIHVALATVAKVDEH